MRDGTQQEAAVGGGVLTRVEGCEVRHDGQAISRQEGGREVVGRGYRFRCVKYKRSPSTRSTTVFDERAPGMEASRGALARSPKSSMQPSWSAKSGASVLSSRQSHAGGVPGGVSGGQARPCRRSERSQGAAAGAWVWVRSERRRGWVRGGRAHPSRCARGCRRARPPPPREPCFRCRAGGGRSRRSASRRRRCPRERRGRTAPRLGE